MKLAKLPYDPGALIQFFQDGLEALGAVCDRTWYDHLQVVAEGQAARLWDPEGQFLETEIRFPPPNETGPRDARQEVFPGCPLVFHLMEALRPAQRALQRAIFRPMESEKTPAVEVAEKLWHSQFGGTNRWRLEAAFESTWHFSLLALLRCEIQAIDQHWSLHRLLLSLPNGQPDEALASQLDFLELVQAEEPVPWPQPDLTHWQELIQQALPGELEPDLAPIRQRQENYLRRELERIDQYFANYEQELAQRAKRTRAQTKFKAEDRLAAAQADHERRRQDQVQRHEIRIIPHLDALLLLAEPAWITRVSSSHHGQSQTQSARFVPRTRKWVVLEG